LWQVCDGSSGDDDLHIFFRRNVFSTYEHGCQIFHGAMYPNG
jgi:hypothetical protein